MRVLGVHDASLDDASAARLWSESGGRWLTDRALAGPGALVKRVLGLVEQLDARGAGLGALVPAEGLGLLAERAAEMGLPPARDVSSGGATRLVSTGNGWIAVSLARANDVELVPAWLQLASCGDDPWAEVHRIAAERPSDVLVERATMLGLPCARLGEVDDRRPVLASRLGDTPPRSPAGALVINLASLWAGPLCADVLARVGARLVTVESTRRPDGGRLARRFFAALHGRSESVALDLGVEAGREHLRRLLRCADVVIEGSRPRALEQMGISAEDYVRDGGPQVWISITSHGRDRAGRDRVGFGDDAAAAGGLVGWVGDEPRFIADAVADPLTGLTAAVAALELLEHGGRWMVDVSLARCAAAATGGWIESDHGPIHRPRPRLDPGARMPLGRDTEAVLKQIVDGAHDLGLSDALRE